MGDRDRYEAAIHAMQTGVATMMNYNKNETSPKHLRVGINSALCDSATLTKLLISKGLITEEEYIRALADMVEAEVKRYEQLLADIGVSVKLV